MGTDTDTDTDAHTGINTDTDTDIDIVTDTNMDTDTDTDTDTIVTTQQLESGVLHPSLVLPQHGAYALHVSLAETPVCVSV